MDRLTSPPAYHDIRCQWCQRAIPAHTYGAVAGGKMMHPACAEAYHRQQLKQRFKEAWSSEEPPYK